VLTQKSSYIKKPLSSSSRIYNWMNYYFSAFNYMYLNLPFRPQNLIYLMTSHPDSGQYYLQELLLSKLDQ